MTFDTQEPRVEEAAAAWLQCPVTGQWVECQGVRRGQEPVVSKLVVQQLGLSVDDGYVLIKMRVAKGGQSFADWFRVIDTAEPALVWNGEAEWRRLVPRKPDSSDASRWDGELEFLEAVQLDQQAEDKLWEAKLTNALRTAEAAGEVGAMLETESDKPNEEVLGPWLHLDSLAEGHAFEYTKKCDAPEWLKSRVSVFVSGGMIVKEGMLERWRAAGADQQILGWIREGGYA